MSAAVGSPARLGCCRAGLGGWPMNASRQSAACPDPGVVLGHSVEKRYEMGGQCRGQRQIGTYQGVQCIQVDDDAGDGFDRRYDIILAGLEGVMLRGGTEGVRVRCVLVRCGMCFARTAALWLPPRCCANGRAAHTVQCTVHCTPFQYNRGKDRRRSREEKEDPLENAIRCKHLMEQAEGRRGAKGAQ
jgi:hypothetical protein